PRHLQAPPSCRNEDHLAQRQPGDRSCHMPALARANRRRQGQKTIADMAATIELESHSAADTQAFGGRLGAALFPGAVVALVGPLGAGKTFLVRAVAEGLDIADSRVVSSPTFVLIQEYAARLPIYHFDVYRLRNPSEFADLGVHEYFQGSGVCLIEWADRVAASLPPEHLQVVIEVTGDNSRRLTLEGRGSRYEELMRSLR